MRPAALGSKLVHDDIVTRSKSGINGSRKRRPLKCNIYAIFQLKESLMGEIILLTYFDATHTMEIQIIL